MHRPSLACMCKQGHNWHALFHGRLSSRICCDFLVSGMLFVLHRKIQLKNESTSTLLNLAFLLAGRFFIFKRPKLLLISGILLVCGIIPFYYSYHLRKKNQDEINTTENSTTCISNRKHNIIELVLGLLLISQAKPGKDT